MPNNCVNKTAYKSWELEAYADGEDLPHVAAHLATCAACTEEYQQLATLGAQIGSKLYRFDCPVPEDLRSYYWQELVASAQAKIQTHITHCIHCTGELERISTFVQADAAAEEKISLKESTDAAVQKLRQQLRDLVDKVDIAVATLVTPLSPQTVGVTLRGAHKESSMLLFEAANTDISITLQPESDQSWKVAGQVLIDTAIVSGEFKLIAEDKESAQNVISERVDETGNFAATSVPSGIYQLIFHLNNSAIVIPNLTIE